VAAVCSKGAHLLTLFITLFRRNGTFSKAGRFTTIMRIIFATGGTAL
jgi:hypothetical protein